MVVCCARRDHQANIRYALFLRLIISITKKIKHVPYRILLNFREGGNWGLGYQIEGGAK